MKEFLIRLLGGVPKQQYWQALKGWKECLDLVHHYESIIDNMVVEQEKKEEE